MVNQTNLRAKMRKMVIPPLRLSDISQATGIDVPRLSKFMSRGTDLPEDAAERVYVFLRDRKLQEVSG